MILKKYRIVKDKFCGFEVQCWRFYFPFWAECMEGGITNTNTTEAKAQDLIDKKGGDKILILKY